MKKLVMLLLTLALCLTACGKDDAENETGGIVETLDPGGMETSEVPTEPSVADPTDVPDTPAPVTPEFEAADYSFTEESLITGNFQFQDGYYATHDLENGSTITGFLTEEAYNLYLAVAQATGSNENIHISLQHRSDPMDSGWNGFFMIEYDDADYVYEVTYGNGEHHFYVVRNDKFVEVPSESDSSALTSARGKEFPEVTRPTGVASGLPFLAIDKIGDVRPEETLIVPEEQMFQDALAACGLADTHALYEVLVEVIQKECEYPDEFQLNITKGTPQYDGVDWTAEFTFANTNACLQYYKDTNTWKFTTYSEENGVLEPYLLFTNGEMDYSVSYNIFQTLAHSPYNSGRWIIVESEPGQVEGANVIYAGGYFPLPLADLDLQFELYPFAEYLLNNYDLTVNDIEAQIHVALANANAYERQPSFSEWYVNKNTNQLCLQFSYMDTYMYYDANAQEWVYVP